MRGLDGQEVKAVVGSLVEVKDLGIVLVVGGFNDVRLDITGVDDNEAWIPEVEGRDRLFAGLKQLALRQVIEDPGPPKCTFAMCNNARITGVLDRIQMVGNDPPHPARPNTSLRHTTAFPLFRQQPH